MENNEILKGQAKVLAEVSKESLTDLTKPSFKFAGEAIANALYRKFGPKKHQTDMQRIYDDAECKALEQALNARLDKIPPESLNFPKKQVLLGAAFDAQFVSEEEILRDMFANLIASACNIETADNVHPQFSNIIRHLSPANAKLLSRFHQTSNRPIAKIGYEIMRQGTMFIYKDVYDPDQPVEEFERQAFNIQCLVAVGLVRIDYSNVLEPPETYDAYNKLVERLRDFTNKNSPGQTVFSKIFSVCGTVELTELGTQFLRICT